MSRQRERPPSPSQGPRAADKIALLERFDGFAPLRNNLRKLAEERGDWAGIPMPIEDLPLVIEPRYPNAEGLMKIGEKEFEGADSIEIRNVFYSHKWRCRIVVFEKDGVIAHIKQPAVHGFAHALNTLGASDAWGIEQGGQCGAHTRHDGQTSAVQALHADRFVHEESPRSNLTYFFRRLRPTVVLHEVKDKMQIMCALCLHPIGYYDDSWAGAMCPTDDVIAHLALMRGDEHMFWKRSNQHPAYLPEAGL